MLIAGNWKMHLDLGEAVALARAVAEAVPDPEGVQVAVCPAHVCLDAVYNALRGSGIRLGAQNVHEADEGAFTGEVSAAMLRSVGCHYVIVGHSERRQLFGETDARIRQKVEQALRHGLVPILCVGETLAEREAGQAEAVVARQLDAALEGLTLPGPDALVVAYEPVWAIGTGHTASPAQAQEMHAAARARVARHHGEALARRLHVLYGGSMKPGNAAELLSQPDVDGGLVGGASLHAADFAAIVQAAPA